MAAGWVAALALALVQDGKQEEKPKGEAFPQWTVNGVLSTDVSAILSDRHSRQTMPEEGVTGEYAIGGSLHLSRRFEVTVRACYGCHQLEVQAAYADYDLATWLTLRAGRIAVPFGGLSRRTSPSQVESTSKPLPYIMGWMVRGKEFNRGIVPAPFVDNGAALLGNLWLGESLQLGFEVAGVRGLKGTASDINFELTRDLEDNNGEPAGAARLALSGDAFTLGASAAAGHHDPDHELSYEMAEADLHVRLGEWNLRLEAVFRRTAFLDALLSEDVSRRLAYAAQIDTGLHDQWRLFVLHDALQVEDVFLGPAGPQAAPSPLTTDDTNKILRFVAGLVYAARPGLLFKGSAEYWNFSDFDDTWVFHVSAVAEF